MNGQWQITYLDTMNTATLVFVESNGIFKESITGLLGKYSKVKNDLTLEFPGLVLPGEKNTIPLTLEAILNNDCTRFKGSIFNKAYPEGRMCVEAVKIEDEDSSDDGVSEDLSLSGHEVKRIIPGTWNIEYVNIEKNRVQTDTTIHFNLDGTFHQKAGDYSGTWICSKKGKLKITFDNVKMSYNKVVLKARVNVTNDSYRFAGNHQFYNFVAFRDS